MKTTVEIDVRLEAEVSYPNQNGCKMVQGRVGNVVFDVTKYEDGNPLYFKFAVDWMDLKKAIEKLGD